MGIVISVCDVLSKHYPYLKRKAAGVGRATRGVCFSRGLQPLAVHACAPGCPGPDH